MATVRPANGTVNNILGQRAKALQSVFPGTTPGVPAIPAPNHLSAAARAAQAVATHLAANPTKPLQPYVTPTRANTPLAQSAATQAANKPTSIQNKLQQQLFVSPAQPANMALFNPPPVPAATPQIGTPAATFPSRTNLLNYLFPR